MRQIKLCLGIFLVFLFNAKSFAQDIHFSNMDYSPLTLNPGLAGASESAQAIVNYRNQWNSIGVPFQTIAASGEMRVSKGNKRIENGFLSFGINLFNDQIGEPRISTNQAAITSAYHLKINNKNFIGLGINAGFGQRALDDGSGQWGNQYNGNQYDASLPSGESLINNSFSYFTTSAGVVYSFNQKNNTKSINNESFSLIAGVAVYNLNRPTYSFINDSDEKLLMRFSGFANASFVFSESKMAFEPGAYFQMQGPSREIFVGGDYKYFLNDGSKITNFIESNSISGGVYYRVGDAIVVRTAINYSNFTVGMSYDFNASRLTQITRGRGGAEIFLAWRLKTNGNYSIGTPRVN